ncbi:T9SS type A sorting domain-containing protein [Emticicia aquatica]|uniref:T9SS type A sorting domain-containing protein n=1 Tax=Emticicia aquatica TaxID=1681835 RepID=UPI001EEAFEA1|nr:T9SS type A sorting domain-containing protein [Emticicia aquatica]
MKRIYTLFLLSFTFSYLAAQNCDRQITIKIDDKYGSKSDYVEICKSTPLTLSLTETFAPSATYQWYLNNQLLENGTSSSQKVEKEGKYSAIIKNGQCTYYTNNIQIRYLENILPYIFFGTIRTFQKDILDDTYTMCSKGGKIDIYGFSNSIEKDITCQWIKDGKDIPYATEWKYTATQPGVYNLRVSQYGCTAVTKQLNLLADSVFTDTKLVVNDFPIKYDTLTFCRGMVAELTTDKISDTKRWYINNVEMPDFANRNKLTVKESGTYQLSLNFDGCKVKTKPLYIEFGNVLPPSEIIRQWSNNCVVSLGDEMVGRDYSAGYNIYKYHWLRDGQEVLTTIGGIFANQPGNYQVYTTLNDICRSKISPKFTIDPVSTPKIYIRDNGYLKKRQFEICSGNSLDLGVEGNINFKNIIWYRDGKEVYSGNLGYFNVNKAGRYIALCFSEGCSVYSDTLDLILRQPINANYNSDCSNGQSILSVPKNTSYQYQWYRNNMIILDATQNQFKVTSSGEYYVSINDLKCSALSKPISIGSRIAGKTTFCEGENLQLSTNTNDNQWYGPKGYLGNGSSISIQKLTSTDDGIYRLRSIFGTNCSYYDSVYVSVTKKPSFDIISSNSKTIECEGKNISLSPSNYLFSGQDLYTWKNSKEQILATSKDLKLKFLKNTDADLYSLEIKNQNGCATTKTFKLDVLPTSACPSIKIDSISTEQCRNTYFDVPFTINAISEVDTFVVLLNNPDPIYGTVIGKGTKSPIKALFPSEYSSTIFYVYALKQKIVSEISQNIVAKESFVPYINYQYAGACSGKSVELKLPDDMVSKYESYTWYKDGEQPIFQNQPIINVDKSGSYGVKATQKNGCIVSSTLPAKVQIGKIDEPVIWAKTSPYVCEGGKVSLTSLGYASDVKFQWKLDNKAINDENATKSDYIAQKTGYYSLQIQQDNCIAESKNVFVSVGKILGTALDKDFLNFNIAYGQLVNPNQIEICNGSDVLLIYDTRLITYPTDGNGYYKFAYSKTDANIMDGSTKVIWQKDGQDITNTDVIEQNTAYFNTFYLVKSTGEYRVKVINGSCVAYSEPMKVDVKSTIKIKLRTDPVLNVCEGKTVFLTYYNIPYDRLREYDWFKNNKRYFDPSSSPVSTIAKESGSYFSINKYEIDNKICEFQSDTVTVKIGGKNADLAFMNLDGDAVTCEDTVELKTQYYYNNSTDFAWKKDGIILPNANKSTLKITQPGVYQAEYKIDDNCLATTKPTKITFKTIKTVINVGNNVLCPNSTKTFDAFINNLGYKDNHTYQWYRNDTLIPNSTSFRFVTAQEGKYRVNLKYKNCSANSEAVYLKKSTISDEIIPKDSVGICPNESITLKINKSSNEKFAWYRDGVLLANNANTLTISQKGIYKAIITDNLCKTESKPTKVNERIILPTATLSGGANLNYGDSTNIKIDFTSSPPWTYQLNDGNATSTDKNPYIFSVKPTLSTSYELLSVKNVCGEGTVSGKADVKVIVLGTENIADVSVNLYPNPTENFCFLDVKCTFPSEFSYILFDSQGRIVENVTHNEKEAVYHEKINLTKLTVGVYHFSLKINGNIINRKIVKLR